MAKWRRIAIASALSLVCATSLVAAVACGDVEEKNDYTVTYAAGASDATGSVSQEVYKEGAPVTLRDCDTFVREGYSFTQWSDGTTLYHAGDTFFMPAKDVTFTAQWEVVSPQTAPDDAEQVSEIPAGKLATSNGSATANWFAEYATGGLKLTAWVQDTTVYTDGSIYANDGVEVIVASVARSATYTENTLSVLVTANGDTLVKNLSTDATVEIEGLTATAKILTVDGTTVAGYRVEIVVPYAAAGIVAADKDAAVMLGFTNASNAGDSKLVYETSLQSEKDRLNTFIAVKDDNLFEVNPFIELGSFWGNGGTLVAKNSWNLAYDDGTANAYIEMTALDGDNNIYMRNTNLSEYYAEVRLHAKELRNNDQFPKFGLSVFSTDGTGFLYFVDARAADGKNFNAASTDLGYVFYNGGTWRWPETMIGTLGSGVTSDAYAGEGNYITLGIYRYNNNFQFYVGNTPLEVITLSDYTQASYAGIVSFNILLSAKNYTVQTDGLETYRETLENKLADKPEPIVPTKTIDGDISDWSATDKTNPYVMTGLEGRKVTIYATRDDNGVYVYYDVYHRQHKTTEAEWWLNTNVEMRVGNGATQFYFNSKSEKNGFNDGDAVMITNQDADSGLYHTVFEGYIPAAHSDLSAYGNSEYVPALFAFKVGGETGGSLFAVNDDWWSTDKEAEIRSILITENGIKNIKATERVIDGVVTDGEWAEEDFRAPTNVKSGASASWAAHFGNDGLYFIIRIEAKGINVTNANASGWHLNTNLESFVPASDPYQTGFNKFRIVIFGGELYYTANVDEAAMDFVAGEDGEADVLTIEFFIANEHLRGGVTADTQGLSLRLGGQLYATEVSDTWQEYLMSQSVTKN